MHPVTRLSPITCLSDYPQCQQAVASTQCSVNLDTNNKQTTCSIVLFEQLTSPQLVKKHPKVHPQVAATCPNPEPDLVHAFPSHFFKIHFNIILPSTPSLPHDLHPSCLPAKTLLHLSRLPYVPRPVHLNLLDQPNHIRQAVQFISSSRLLANAV